jgi:hypothetical protein
MVFIVFFFRIFRESIKENRFFETLLTMIDLRFFFFIYLF